MSKSAKNESHGKGAAAGQLWLQLPGLVREALYDTVIGAGLACVDEVLETERVALCGGRLRIWPRVRRYGPATPAVPWCWAGAASR